MSGEKGSKKWEYKTWYQRVMEGLIEMTNEDRKNKREDVVAGLKKMRDNAGCKVVRKRDCETCPYSNVHYCCDQILDDALELLEAKEARER